MFAIYTIFDKKQFRILTEDLFWLNDTINNFEPDAYFVLVSVW